MSTETRQEFLKECIADALLILMKKESFEKISITDITKLANVGRVTYYRHFKSKEDILVYKIDLLLEQWTNSNRLSSFKTQTEVFVSLFQYFTTIREPIDIIIKSGMESALLMANYRIFEQKTDLPIGEAYKYCYHSMGLSGLLLAWVKRGMKETPQEMGEIANHTIFQTPCRNSI